MSGCAASGEHSPAEQLHAPCAQVHSPQELQDQLRTNDGQLVVLMCKAASCRPCKVRTLRRTACTLLPAGPEAARAPQPLMAAPCCCRCSRASTSASQPSTAAGALCSWRSSAMRRARRG